MQKKYWDIRMVSASMLRKPQGDRNAFGEVGFPSSPQGGMGTAKCLRELRGALDSWAYDLNSGLFRAQS